MYLISNTISKIKLRIRCWLLSCNYKCCFRRCGFFIGKISVIWRPKQTFPIGCAVYKWRKHTLRLWHRTCWSRLSIFTHQKKICCWWVCVLWVSFAKIMLPQQLFLPKKKVVISSSFFYSSFPLPALSFYLN